jgi:hypothetical protein
MPQADEPARPDRGKGPIPEMAARFIDHANSFTHPGDPAQWRRLSRNPLLPDNFARADLTR